MKLKFNFLKIPKVKKETDWKNSKYLQKKISKELRRGNFFYAKTLAETGIKKGYNVALI